MIFCYIKSFSTNWVQYKIINFRNPLARPTYSGEWGFGGYNITSSRSKILRKSGDIIIILDYTRRAGWPRRGSCVENIQKSEVEFRSGTSEWRQMDWIVFKSIKKCDIMRVLSVSTGTHFITGLVSLDFCEGYMKIFYYFFKSLKKNLREISNHPWKICTAQNRAFSTARSILWT